MGTILGFWFSLGRGMFRSQAELALENAALRQQLGAYLRRGKRSKLRPADRALWVAVEGFLGIEAEIGAGEVHPSRGGRGTDAETKRVAYLQARSASRRSAILG